MKKLNKVQAVSFLAVGLLLANVANAVDDNAKAPNFGLDLSRISTLLSTPFAKKPDAASSAAPKDAVTAQFVRDTTKKAEELAKVATDNQKEIDKRAVNDAKTSKLESLISLADQPRLMLADYYKKAEKDNEATKSKFAQMMSPVGSGLNSSDVDMSGAEAACSDKVDFGQFTSFSAQMKSEPFAFVKREGVKMLKEFGKSYSQHALETFLALAKSAKENKAAAKNPANLAQEAFQKKFSELAKTDLDKDDASKAGVEDRLADLDEESKRLDKGIQTWEDKALDETVHLVKSLQEDGDNKEKVQELASQFADNLEQFRVAAVNSAKKAADQLYSNCKNVAAQIGRDNPRQANTLLGTAYNMLTAYYNGDPNSYANTFLQQASSEARLMQCKQASQSIEQHMGASLQAKFKSVATAAKPETLLQGAMAALNALAVGEQEAGKAIAPARSACNKLAKFKKGLESFAGNVQSQLAGQAAQQSGAPAARRGMFNPALNNQMAGSNATHFGPNPQS